MQSTVEDRFWAKVRPTGFCWEWTAATLRGYGVFTPQKGTQRYAHRFAYELMVGPIPAGLQIDHLCRNILCVNPDHLEPVTPRENTLRSFGVTARQARQTHCKNGHEFTTANTYVRGTSRVCRTCYRAWDRARARARVRRATAREKASQ